MTEKRRIALLDELRGLSVFCMVFYHGFFILDMWFDLSWAGLLFDFFTPAQPFFAGLFICLSGISCRLSRSNLKRGGKLLGVALALTAVTVWLLPLLNIDGAQVYFGILHCLSICMLLFALLEKPLSHVPPAVLLLVCILLYLLTGSISARYLGVQGIWTYNLPHGLYESKWLFPLGFPTAGFFSADYFPLLPHVFLFFAGAALGVPVAQDKLPKWVYPVHLKFFAFLGRHALLVYIIHEAAIYALAWVAAQIISLF